MGDSSSNFARNIGFVLIGLAVVQVVAALLLFDRLPIGIVGAALGALVMGIVLVAVGGNRSGNQKSEDQE